MGGECDFKGEKGKFCNVFFFLVSPVAWVKKVYSHEHSKEINCLRYSKD
jgi:hypothetical protein